MGTNHVSATSQTVSPEHFTRALTDFGEGRSQLWGNAEAKYLRVHGSGETWADVTEGTAKAGGIWQRSRYDWSNPGVVKLDVTDGNLFGRGSWWEYRIDSVPGGGCLVHLTVSRSPRSLRGRLLDAVLTTVGSFQFKRDLQRSLRLLASGAP